MKKKLILVLIDALNYDSRDYLGYMKALCKEKKANEYKVSTELPSLSRPLYELILTGVSPIKSGVVNNEVSRLSKFESVFSLANKNNLKTGASAYYWIGELYNFGKFNYLDNMEVDSKKLNINHGRFYWEDEHPDKYVFAQGELIRRKNMIDFLLIHPMNVDDRGHKYGGKSKEYKDTVRKESNILSKYIPIWLEENYEIIVTSDHGMSEEGNHGGNFSDENTVPLWIIGKELKNIRLKKDKEGCISQKIIAPLCCDILGIKKSKDMEEVLYEKI